MKDFKLFGGLEIENLGVYLREYYALHPEIKVFVGTDSAQHGKVTKYATVVALMHPGKGVHIVYKRNNINREKDMFTRLWNETEYTREIAEYVHESLIDVYEHKKDVKIPVIHLDFNKDPKHKSHIVHDLSVGYLKGFGFDAYTKDGAWVASCCADSLVKN